MREWIFFSLLSLVIGLTFAVSKVRAGRAMTFSAQAAQHPLAYVVFALGLTVSSVLLFLHTTTWLAPHLGLGSWFSGLMAVGCAAIIIAGWVPASKGLARRIHYYAAYAIIVMILIVIAAVSLAPNLSEPARNVELAVLAVLGLLWSLIHRHPKARESLLLYEGLYFVCFFVGIIAATYL